MSSTDESTKTTPGPASTQTAISIDPPAVAPEGAPVVEPDDSRIPIEAWSESGSAGGRPAGAQVSTNPIDERSRARAIVPPAPPTDDDSDAPTMSFSRTAEDDDRTLSGSSSDGCDRDDDDTDNWHRAVPAGAGGPLGGIRPRAQTPGAGDASNQKHTIPSIPGYRIECEIGQGGMGRVYLALNLQLKRREALKTLLAERLGSTGRARFFSEARAAAQLSHANIVPVYECRDSETLPYYTMALVQAMDGSPAASGRELIRRFKNHGATALNLMQIAQLAGVETAPLPPALVSVARSSAPYFRLVAHWIAEVADALECAHRAGILHRDIKPSNVMLGADGRMMLADFGLAKSNGDADVTSGGMIMGTSRYLAPELLKGVRPGAQCDVLSLGLTLYEFLTLCPARKGNSDSELIHEIVCEDPPPPASLMTNLPDGLNRICLTAIAKQPADRFRTAGEFARRLRDWLANESGAAAVQNAVAATSEKSNARPPTPPVRSRVADLTVLCIVAVITAALMDTLILPRITGYQSMLSKAYVAMTAKSGEPAEPLKSDQPEKVVIENGSGGQRQGATSSSTTQPAVKPAVAEPAKPRQPQSSVPGGPAPDPARAPRMAWIVSAGRVSNPQAEPYPAAVSDAQGKLQELLRAKQRAGVLGQVIELNGGLEHAAADAAARGADYVLLIEVVTTGVVLKRGEVDGVESKTAINRSEDRTTVEQTVRNARDQSTADYTWTTTFSVVAIETHGGSEVSRITYSPSQYRPVQSPGASAIGDAVRKSITDEQDGLDNWCGIILEHWKSRK